MVYKINCEDPILYVFRGKHALVPHAGIELYEMNKSLIYPVQPFNQ